MNWLPAGLWTFALLASLAGPTRADDRPNILWVTSEDNSPFLGCYGDPLAETPNLDRLAAQGVRYLNAFANAPVCSTARSTLITGMHATSLGVHHHRSRVIIPKHFRLYPEYLRGANSYCSNNSKTDYNIADAGTPWDESSPRAHYRHRADGQSFFAVFNITTSHESRVAPPSGKANFRVHPDRVVLPPWHPDTPEIRLDWANYYDQLTLMDRRVGELLRELEQEGLADDTIVFYFSDHGGALPRGKRNLHDSGTRVPLIIRFPEKWAHLAPSAPGSTSDRLVSFVDLPATILSLCGVQIPPHFEGSAFLGEQEAPPRSHVFLYRGRMDERYDTSRAVRDRRFRYIRNYSPHRPWGQHYSYPFQVLPSMRSWFDEFEAGRCDEIQSAYWKPKPPEELYDLTSDPHEVHNLATDPQHAAIREGLRKALEDELVSTRDAGFIPEGMSYQLAGDSTIYDYARGSAYPIRRIVRLADLASSGDARSLPGLIRALDDPHPVLRYWGALGCLVLQGQSAPAKDRLMALLRDDWPDIRVTAAEAVGYLGESEAALDVLDDVIHGDDLHATLAALNAIEFMWKAGHVSLDRVKATVDDLELAEPANRIPDYLLQEH